MSELGPRQIEPPLNGDLGAWAAQEVAKHEDLCGLRYLAIEKQMKATEEAMLAGLAAANARSQAIENKISGGIKWVMGIVGSLAVSLVLMAINTAHTQSQADESDKREMRARLSLLTTQLANVNPRAVVVTPPGSQTTTLGDPPAIAPDADDMATASGQKPGKP